MQQRHLPLIMVGADYNTALRRPSSPLAFLSQLKTSS